MDKDLFRRVLAKIEGKISSANYVTWFAKLSLVELDREAKVAQIGVPSVFISKQLQAKYYDLLLQYFKECGAEVERLEFSLKSAEGDRTRRVVARNEEGINYGGSGRASSVGEVAGKNFSGNLSGAGGSFYGGGGSSGGYGSYGGQRGFSTGLNSNFTLDTFVVGSNNDLAAGAAKWIVDDPGGKCNPFFLYGGPGLGKTHLVQAIGNALLEKYPGMKVFYVPTNHFYAEFVTAVRTGKGEEFVKKYRNLDALIIDDFQLIVGKEKSQEEFFNIFNDLHQAGKQIIITSDRMPDQIKTLDLRLASRLTMGGAYDIQFPGFEDRCAILKAKAEFLGYEVEDEAIEFLADTVKTNIRDLEGEFKKLMVMAEVRGVSPLQVIHDGYISGSVMQRKRRVTPGQVVEKVAKYYGLTVVEMTGKSRVSNIKTARQVAMYLLSKELGMSTTKIAPEVGVKDHTTVMNGIKKIENDQKSDPQLKDQVEQIRENIYS